MWIGGYHDWPPAEQREWDRGLEKLEAGREQSELTAKTVNENTVKMDTRPWDI